VFIKSENNRWYVLSDAGTIMGVFSTEEGAKKFSEQYGALKQYSSTVRDKGSDQAMDLFLQRFRAADKGL